MHEISWTCVPVEGLLEEDPVMMEYAPKAVTCSFLYRTDLFDSCQTKSEFQSTFKEISDKAKDTKMIAATIWKCVREMISMIKVPWN